MNIVFIFILCLCNTVLFFITYGGCFADFREASERRGDFSEKQRNEDMGNAILFSLFQPISFIVMFLSTGFFRSGFRWR